MGNPYESDRSLAEYLLFHYGRPEEVIPYRFGPTEALDFPVRVVQQCVLFEELPAKARALDLGCAVGRSSFELARLCAGGVVGVDFSRRFINSARRLQLDGALSFHRADEGDLTTECIARTPAGVSRDRVKFEVGDACNLREGLGKFDVVLMANLIDRVADPERCLARVARLLNPGGQLIIASPFTWLEEHTPKTKWLGGYERDGGRVGTFDALIERLAADFELERSLDLPFLIREHARKFQWSVSRAGVWRRR